MPEAPIGWTPVNARDRGKVVAVVRGNACPCASPWKVLVIGSRGGSAAKNPHREPAYAKRPPPSSVLLSGFLGL